MSEINESVKTDESWMPQYLQAPMQWLFWEIEEALALIGGLILFMLTKQWIWAIAGYGASKIIEKYKTKATRGVFKHILYNYGMLDLTGYPPGISREFNE